MRSPESDSDVSFRHLEKLLPRQKAALNRLLHFYTLSILELIIVPLIEQTATVSLRALDWLVTNYSKKTNIVCISQGKEPFNIFHGYKVALAHWRRKNFDPFRRRQRISFIINEKVFYTTVGQLNFIHWACVNGVLDYAHAHAHEIENDMNTATAQNKLERKHQRARGVLHKRKELSAAPLSKCHVYNVTTRVSFVESDLKNKD